MNEFVVSGLVKIRAEMAAGTERTKEPLAKLVPVGIARSIGVMAWRARFRRSRRPRRPVPHRIARRRPVLLGRHCQPL
jgi:hypothetical protein